MSKSKCCFALGVALSACISLTCGAQTAHTLAPAPGKTITLSLPDDLDIHIAAGGLHRVRFFAQSPDGRISSQVCTI